MAAESNFQFKVISLHDMKMTIKREQNVHNKSVKAPELTGFNNHKRAECDNVANYATKEFGLQTCGNIAYSTILQPKTLGNFDLMTVKTEPDSKWSDKSSDTLANDHGTICEHTLSYSNDNLINLGKMVAADLETENICVKVEHISREEKFANLESISTKTEPKGEYEMDTSWIKTELLWEFDSRTHLNCESDMMGPVARVNAELQSVKSTFPVAQEVGLAVSGSPSQAGEITPAYEPVKTEVTSDEEEEVKAAEEFVVEIDVAVEAFEDLEFGAAHEVLDATVKLEAVCEKTAPQKSEKGEDDDEADLPVQFRQTISEATVGRRKRHQMKKTKEHACDLCGVNLSSDLQCIQHLQTRHAMKNVFICVHCNQVFSQPLNLLEHEKIHDLSDRKTSQNSCDECGMSFPTLTGLRCHTRLHTENKAYKCPDCDKVFTHIYTLTLHKKLHEVKKDHTCEKCGMSFHRPEYLKHHMRKHSGERPFVCKMCSKTFTNSSNLSAHLRTHTGEKPYKCSVCLATFTTSSALTVHKWRHTDTKPFKCEHCGRTFTTANTYKRHKVMHTGQKDFKCMECGKAFTQPSSLTIHMRSHTGERPFYCTECGATFTQSAHLTVHVRTHTGERPFVCDMCSQAFPRSEYLLKHKRRVHGLNVTSFK